MSSFITKPGSIGIGHLNISITKRLIGPRWILLLVMALAVVPPFNVARAMETPAPSSSPPSEQPNKPKTTKYALVVGISHYLIANSLRVSHKDATDVCDLLTTAGGGFERRNVRLLCDGLAPTELPTRDNIFRAAADIARRIKSNDTVLVYFSCHGDAIEDKSGRHLYLLPSDVDPTRVTETAVAYEQLVDLLRGSCEPKRLIVILDACYSGAGKSLTGSIVSQDTPSRDDVDIRELDEIASGTYKIFSSLPDQVSQEMPRGDGDNSIFTHFLLRGLEGGADSNSDEIVTITEVANYVCNQLINWSKNRNEEDRQYAKMKFDSTGDVPLVRTNLLTYRMDESETQADSTAASEPAAPSETQTDLPPPQEANAAAWVQVMSAPGSGETSQQHAPMSAEELAAEWVEAMTGQQ